MKPTLSIIIPCFNEEDSLPQLKDKLTPALQQLRETSYECIFVDDGSTDSTVKSIVSLFPNAKIFSHLENRGLGVALKTGARGSQGDLLAFFDSDCTYDPLVLAQMLELRQDADIVTVSPYHPKGKVLGVPVWRLFFSKGLSFLLRWLLPAPFYTYTAMVRVIRRELFWKVATPNNQYGFVSEFFVRAILGGARVKELPATLSNRKFGHSKIKLAQTIRMQICFLLKLIFTRQQLQRDYFKGDL